MLDSLYEKTKSWGPGSCIVVFYFLSLIPIIFTIVLNSLTNEKFTLGGSFPIQNLDLFLKSLFFAPWFETLLINVFLTKVFIYSKVRSTNILLIVSFIFSCLHFSGGLMNSILIFIPALMFQWNYLIYEESKETMWGILSTTVLHFLYNFTIFVILPMIDIVLTTFYLEKY